MQVLCLQSLHTVCLMPTDDKQQTKKDLMQELNSGNMIFWFFLVLFILSIVLICWLLLPFFPILILAAVITGIFRPIYKFFNVTDKINSPFASFLTCMLIFFILFIPMFLLVGQLAKEAQQLYFLGKDALISSQNENFIENSMIFNKASVLFAKFNIDLSIENANKWISNMGKDIGLFLFEQARAITADMLKILISFFFMLLVIYYLLIDGDKLIQFIIKISPLPNEQDEKLIKKFKDMGGAILIGNGLGGIIQGIIGGIVFSLFGIKSPFLWGVLMSLLAFLPILGIGIVFIPAAIYFLLNGHIASGVFFIIFYVVLSFGIEYLFKPKLVGNRIKMHTLLVFLSIVGGLNLFGILGIIYGPLIISGFITLTDIYITNYQRMVEHPEEIKQR